MPKKPVPLYPAAKRQLNELGERLRTARLRRRMTQQTAAERIGVSLSTLRKLEAGDPSVSFATALRLLQVLGMGSHIDMLAADDPLGRELQDAHLTRPRGRS